VSFRVKGHLTPGYYRDSEQTRAAFDADGAFVTGDLGLVGEDGRLRFRGRLKELIKTGGANVAPLEVEVSSMARRRTSPRSRSVTPDVRCFTAGCVSKMASTPAAPRWRRPS